MTTRQLHHLYYNAKELKLPLELGIKIPFASEARTFDEVFHKSGVEKYLSFKEKGRKGHNLVSMLKLVLFCNMIVYVNTKLGQYIGANLGQFLTPNHSLVSLIR
ncbi:MAG TPA: hypothetical protein GX708_00945, partial [Gallicola sp.]|nr:hypothetical protein [Gallicola sp.]